MTQDPTTGWDDPVAPLEPARGKPRTLTWILLGMGGCLLLLVVGFGVFAALVVPQVKQRLDEVFQTVALQQIGEIDAAMSRYRDDRDRWPGSLEDLLVEDADGHRYLDRVPRDPWERPYVFEPATEELRPRVLTYGEDGEPGGEGTAADLANRD